MQMASKLGFCANFQLVFGTLQQEENKKPKQDFGIIKEPMTPTVTLCGWGCSLPGVSGREKGVRLCSRCCRVSVGPRGGTGGPRVLRYLGHRPGCRAQSFRWFRLNEKIHQRLKTSRPQNTNAKIFRGNQLIF